MDRIGERHASVLSGERTAAVQSTAYGIARQRTSRRRIHYGPLMANVALAAIGVAFAIPAVWVLVAAFDAHATNALEWPNFSLANFSGIFAKSLVVGPMGNSLYISAVTTIVATAFGLMAAYPISRHRIPFKRPFLYVILFAAGLPINTLLVPVYSMFVSFGMIDSLTWTSVFLAATSLPFAIWVLKNFIDAIPIELEEAAHVDGASTIQTLRHVALPLAIPGVLVSAMFTFMGAWSTFLVPYILLETPGKLPGAITIYQFEGAYGAIQYGQLAAYSLLFSIPVVVLYWVASRHLSGAFNFGGGIQG